MEAYCQLQIGMDLEYITEEELLSVKDQFIEVSRLLNALSKSFKNKL